MSSLSEIKAKRKQILAIATRNEVSGVSVFGSVVIADDGPDSDVDFLVRLENGASLMDLGGGIFDMELLLGRKVDAVPEESLHWVIKDDVMKEAKAI